MLLLNVIFLRGPYGAGYIRRQLVSDSHNSHFHHIFFHLRSILLILNFEKIRIYFGSEKNVCSCEQTGYI